MDNDSIKLKGDVCSLLDIPYTEGSAAVSLSIINSNRPKPRKNCKLLTIGLRCNDQEDGNLLHATSDACSSLSADDCQLQSYDKSNFVPVNLISSYLEDLFYERFPKPVVRKSDKFTCKWGCVYIGSGARKVFGQKENGYTLIRHYLTQHKDIPVKDYGIQCPECKAYFMHDVTLKRHFQDGDCVSYKLKLMSMQLNTGKKLSKDIFMNACPHCNVVFLSKKRFKKHLVSTDSNTCAFAVSNRPAELGKFDVMKCKYCDKTFLFEDDFLDHIKVPTANVRYFKKPDLHRATFKCRGVSRPSFSCPLCKTKYKSETQYKLHIFADHELEEFGLKCDRCNKQFRFEVELNDHKSINAKFPRCIDYDACRTIPKRKCNDETPDEAFILGYPICPVCSITRNDRARLLSHLKRYHPDYDIDQLKCSDCHRVFLTVEDYNDHMTKWKCPFCVEPQAIFPNKRFLREHCWRHTTAASQHSEPVYCQFCNAPLKTEESLQTHINNFHSNLLNACPFCGETDDNRINMFKHIRSFHVYWPPKVKSFNCDLCESKAAFVSEEGLARHIAQVHNKAEKTECDVCHKSFAQRATMMRHRRIHFGIKPFKCGICELTFTQKTGMRAHKARHYNKDGTLKSADEITTQVETIKRQRDKDRGDTKASGKRSSRKMKKKSLTCKSCGCQYSTNDEYNSHCCKTIDRMSSAIDEEGDAHEYDFDCKNCNKKFVSIERFYSHRCLEAKITEEDSFEVSEAAKKIENDKDNSSIKPDDTSHKLRKSKRIMGQKSTNSC